MKTIIAGSRGIEDNRPLGKAINECGWKITEVVCGMARGIDYQGLVWAYANDIPVKKFEADWERYGKAAGPMRNLEMARYAEALIAIWDGESPGTKHIIRMAKDKGLKVFVMNIGDPFVQSELGL